MSTILGFNICMSAKEELFIITFASSIINLGAKSLVMSFKLISAFFDVPLRNIFAISPDSGIYYGGCAHYNLHGAGFATLLDVNYREGGLGDFPVAAPKDVVFIYPQMSEKSEMMSFKSNPLFPLYTFDARDMTPQEFANKCQDVIVEHRKYIDELEKDQQRGGGR